MITIDTEIRGQKKSFKFDPTRGRLESPALAAITQRLENLGPAFDEAHDLLLEIERSIFNTEGANIGRPWPKYNQAEQPYVNYKRAILGNEEPMMRWKGGNEKLFPSLTEKTHPKHIFKQEKYSFEFGTAVPYAKGHHTGTGLGWKGRYTVPKRALIGTDWRGLGKVIQTIQAYIFGSAGPRKSRGGVFA